MLEGDDGAEAGNGGCRCILSDGVLADGFRHEAIPYR